MNPSDVHLIRDGFRQLATDATGLAADFYARLFEIDPSLRRLFKADVAAQGAKLLRALAHVVRGLDRLDSIIDDVRVLARRHKGYGVRPEHYASAGQALLDTLECRLGPSFDAVARAAWSKAYAILSQAMISAAGEAGSRAAVAVSHARAPVGRRRAG
jgi:hemoglobin-like flavoprotein